MKVSEVELPVRDLKHLRLDNSEIYFRGDSIRVHTGWGKYQVKVVSTESGIEWRITEYEETDTGTIRKDLGYADKLEEAIRAIEELEIETQKDD